MVMNPRTHPRGAVPDFTLPYPNPSPLFMTDALWWLVCMREALEPADSANGGTYANKPGFHNVGANLKNYGQGDSRTDHSIRHAVNRSGPWLTKSAAHDWTFWSAQRGDYSNISKYTKRLINSMKSLTDTRPDDVYWYTLGQADNDVAVEGWHENTDEILSSSDLTHLWHRHDSFRRNIVGSFWHMWKALTIDMGWTFEEWQKSVAPPPKEEEQEMALSPQDLADVRTQAKLGFYDALKEAAAAADTDETTVSTPTGRQLRDFFNHIIDHANQEPAAPPPPVE